MISISNIAWDISDEEQAARTMRQLGLGFVDVAPTKYFREPAIEDKASVTAIRSLWKSRGFKIAGMQSLLFARPDLRMFGSREQRQEMVAYLTRIMDVASWLDCTKLVFGSPKNRDTMGRSSREVTDIASDFFQTLGVEAGRRNLLFCVEAAPQAYGGNFLTTTEEVGRAVAAVDHPNIALQWDTGAILLGEENPHALASTFGGFVGHIHLSEPGLEPLGSFSSDAHQEIHAARRIEAGTMVHTIEMKQIGASALDETIYRAVNFAKETYEQ